MNRFELSDLNIGAHIHFIGIGGISMSGLAEICIERGFSVSGSDRSRSHITDKLEAHGAKIYIGHKAENVSEADLAVHTAAVHEDNPEMAECAARGIKRIDRAEFLGALMKCYEKSIGVSGTHGKTTTTSMLAHALIYAKKDPTVSVGGELDIIGGNIKAGGSEYFLTEACEYTNSFLKFFPKIAVITNIEADHLDFFSGIDEIIESFGKFARLTEKDGCVIAWGEDKNIKKALKNTDCRITYYGIAQHFTYHPENLCYRGGFAEFDVVRRNEKICHIALNVPGEHNVLNALAAVAVCDEYGIDPLDAAKGIESFKGTHRRFEKTGELNGAPVIADYAHHPTEIKATLNTAEKFGRSKIWCVFQPHTYTRTKLLWKDFLTCFDTADELILTDIYAAREMPDGVTTSEGLAAAIGNNTLYIKDFPEIAEYLKKHVAAEDMVFVMGAGDIIDLTKLLK